MGDTINAFDMCQPIPHLPLSGNKATVDFKLYIYSIITLIQQSLPSDTIIPAKVVLQLAECAFLSSRCASINIQSLGSFFHTNSNCSYIKRYYYILFTLVHSVVKFGHIWFLTYCYSIRYLDIFISCPSHHTLQSQTITPALHVMKMRISDEPCTLAIQCMFIVK